MTNLMTSGLTYALISSNNSAQMSTKPMRIAMREMKKREPNMAMVNQAMGYGVGELSKADKANDSAKEELIKAKKISDAEIKAEKEKQIIENSAEKATGKENVEAVEASEAAKTTETTNETVTDTNKTEPLTEIVVNADGTTSKIPKADTIKISHQAASILNPNVITPIVGKIPKIYMPTGLVSVPSPMKTFNATI